MHFNNLITKQRADVIKERIRQAFSECKLTFQTLESATSIDYNHHQRSLDLTNDYYPSIILPALLMGHGEDCERFARMVVDIISETVRKIDPKKLDGSIQDEELDIATHLGKLIEQAKSKNVDAPKCRKEITEIIRLAEQALAELDTMDQD